MSQTFSEGPMFALVQDFTCKRVVADELAVWLQQTPALFVKDLLKGYALTTVIAPPIIAGIITIVKVS
jgi:hypothetical protein